MADSAAFEADASCPRSDARLDCSRSFVVLDLTANIVVALCIPTFPSRQIVVSEASPIGRRGYNTLDTPIPKRNMPCVSLADHSAPSFRKNSPDLLRRLWTNW